MSLDTKLLLDEMHKLGDRFTSTSWSFCTGRSSLSKGNNHQMSASNLFDEMTRSDFEEWRSPSCILEVTIHKVCYPITEFVLLQVFGSFGVVEQVHVFGGTDVVLSRVVFESKEVAADAFGELHGRNIYDDCCRMEIKWGLYRECAATPDTSRGTMESCSTTDVPELHSSPMAFSVSETSSSSSSTPIPTPAARGAEERTSTASPTRCSSECLFHDIDLLKPISAAVISTPTPVTPPNTEEETPAISPTWCSSDYLHGDAHELVKQDISKQVKLVPVTRMAISAKLSSTFMDAQVLFEDMPQRVYHYLST